MGANKKTKQIIDLYRTLVDPMGYTIVLKKTETAEAEKWKPENKEVYLTKDGKTIIDSIELEKKIQELKVQSEGLKKVMGETKQKIITFMNMEPPNDLTNILYTNSEGKAINPVTIRVFSKRLDYVTKLIDYIIELKRKKLMYEMLAKVKVENENISTLEVCKETGGPQLKVNID